MITLTKIGDDYNSRVLEISGLSTDEKPVDTVGGVAITNSSLFKEIDTGFEYLYDQDSKSWIKKPVASGGAAVQSDWEQTDENQLDFIKNKPDIDGAIEQAKSQAISTAAADATTKADAAKNQANKYTDDAVNKVNSKISNKANTKHSHTISDVTGLQDALDNRMLTEDVIEEITKSNTENKTYKFSINQNHNVTSGQTISDWTHGYSNITMYKVAEGIDTDVVEAIYNNGNPQLIHYSLYDTEGGGSGSGSSSYITYKNMATGVQNYFSGKIVHPYNAPVYFTVGDMGIYTSYEKNNSEYGGGYTFLDGLEYGYTITNTTTSQKIKEELLPDDVAMKDDLPPEQVQANWAQTNRSAKDYIKNKPVIPAAQIQSDFEQADNTATDYIKNRPFYETYTYDNTAPLYEVTMPDSDKEKKWEGESGEAGLPRFLDEGYYYVVVYNETEYLCKCDNSQIGIGDEYLVNYPFCYDEASAAFMYCATIKTADIGATVKFYKATSADKVQLDVRHIPDAIARQKYVYSKIEWALDQAELWDSWIKSRVIALESNKHTHTNKDELDLITPGDKAKWDAAANNFVTLEEVESAIDAKLGVIANASY